MRIELLKESDIVVTNPPFSLFREYVAQLVEYDKKFVVIGNMNAITYKEIFPLIKHNKIWIGYTSMSKDLLFLLPKKKQEEILNNNKLSSAYIKLLMVKYYALLHQYGLLILNMQHTANLWSW